MGMGSLPHLWRFWRQMNISKMALALRQQSSSWTVTCFYCIVRGYWPSFTNLYYHSLLLYLCNLQTYITQAMLNQLQIHAWKKVTKQPRSILQGQVPAPLLQNTKPICSRKRKIFFSSKYNDHYYWNERHSRDIIMSFYYSNNFEFRWIQERMGQKCQKNSGRESWIPLCYMHAC